MRKKLLGWIGAFIVLIVIWFLKHEGTGIWGIIFPLAAQVGYIALIVESGKISELSNWAPAYLLTVSSSIIALSEMTPFAEKAAIFYSVLVEKMFAFVEMEPIIQISEEKSCGITLSLLTCLYIGCDIFKEKILGHSIFIKKKNYLPENLKTDDFKQRRKQFCSILKRELEKIDDETNWSQSKFTPLDAEVEENDGGKIKKRHKDLLTCLKRNRKKNTVYLVQGDPGSGKSVALRKLCVDMLTQVEHTDKIPLYINLKEWNQKWGDNEEPRLADLISFIRENIGGKAPEAADFLDKYFDDMRRYGCWYFVFDSFDELACLMGIDSDDQLINRLSTMLSSFIISNGESGGVVASRFYKAPTYQLKATSILTIQEFTDNKIKLMIEKCGCPNPRKAVKELFSGNQDLVELCRNPFYLSLYVTCINSCSTPEKPPQNQTELYEQFITNRLKEKKSFLNKEGITEMIVKNGAVDLAEQMHLHGGGLEYSFNTLYQTKKKQSRAILLALKEAKICRFGGENDVVSFVHRRFQEYFLVESIKRQYRNKAMTDEDIRTYITSDETREAMVVYCEVASTEESTRFAKCCWGILQEHKGSLQSIQRAGCMDAIKILRFMRDAFRNKKQAIVDFQEEFYQMTQQIIREGRIAVGEQIESVCYLAQEAFVENSVLFSGSQRERLIIDAFKINNRNINDIIMRNCRNIGEITRKIEVWFIDYFDCMNSRIFCQRFRDMHFSLDTVPDAHYLKQIHTVVLMTNIIRYLYGIFIFEITLHYCLQYITSASILESNRTGFLILILFPITFGLLKSPFLYRSVRIAFYGCFIFIIGDLIGLSIPIVFRVIYLIYSVIIVATEISLSIRYRCFRQQLIVFMKLNSIFIIVVIAFQLIQLVKNIFEAIIGTRIIDRIFAAIDEIIIKISDNHPILKYFPLMLVLIFLGYTFFPIVVEFYAFVNEYIKIQKQLPAGKIEHRRNVEEHLQKMKYNDNRCCYLRMLLKNDIILTGEWTDNCFPNTERRDSEVYNLLTKLDERNQIK